MSESKYKDAWEEGFDCGVEAQKQSCIYDCDKDYGEYTNGYEQGRADAIKEYDEWLSTYNVTTDYHNHRIMVDRGGIKRYASDLYLEQMKEQKA